MNPEKGQSRPLPLVVGGLLAVEALTAQVHALLSDAGVHHAFLKGPADVRWLTPDSPEHVPGDVDVLISLEDQPVAESALSAIGFRPIPVDAIPFDRPKHHRELLREHDGRVIELHHTLVGAKARPDVVWSSLVMAYRSNLRGAEIPVLDRPGRVMHLALHAAHHGPQDRRTTEFLRLAVDVVDIGVWREALELAQRIDATEAMATGLSLTANGTTLMHELGLYLASSTEHELRLASASEAAHSMEYLAHLPTLRGKIQFVLHRVFPPKRILQAQYRFESGSFLRLGRVYLRNASVLARRTVPAFLAWRAARKRASKRR